ncbi:oligopeptide transporter 4 [Phakopsora pachyrhizi]|nr:oligopeptide transporter 4 [Phakopsora pachyrhizi]
MLKHPTSNKGKNQSAENNTTAYQPPPRPQTAVNNNHQSFDLYQDEVWDEDELIEEEEEEEEDEDDEDEGMFSFAPPPENSIQQQQPTVINPNQSSSLQTPPSIYQPNHLNHHHQNSYNLSQQQQQHQQHSHDHPRNHPHDHQPQSPPPPAPPPGWSPSFSPKPPYPTSYPPPQPSTITPAAAIIAQYHRHPETRHRKPNLSTPPNTNHLTNPALQQHGLLPSSRAFSSAISNSSNANNNSKNKNKNSTPNSIEDTPVIELRTGFNAATWRAANHDSDDHESVKSGSSHSLHKLDYYHHSAHSVQSDNQSHKDSAGFLNRFISRSNVDPQINSGKIDTITGSLAAGIEAGPGLDIKNYSDSQSHLTHGIDGYNMDDFDMDEEDSPYPEVRASVSNIDDPEMPCLTFRAWLLGLFFVIICGSLNMFFQLRYPSPFITPVIVQIISYPAGKLCAAILPDTIYRLPGGKGHKRNGFKGFLDRIWPSWLGAGAEWSLNSGPFNIKEHTVIAIMANAAVGPVYAVNTTLVMEKFYKRPPGAGFDFCIALATQLLGFSLAGVTRRFLIWPASMIWPSNLVICTLLNTFHAEDDDGSDGSLTRFKFFMYVSFGAFVWYWFPGNRLVNQLFGTTNGLGLSILTFDWSQIAYIGSPLVAPWWAEVNVAVGFVIFFYILGPILYYTNTWSQAYLPLGGTSVYDRFGKPYNTTRVVDLNTGALNLTAYQEYSPLFLPATFTAVYSIAFALATSAIVHTVLYHGHSIWDKIKNIKTEDEDVHAKLMRNYPEVPDWWYWSYFLLFSGFSIIFIEVYDTGLPIWGLLLALFVALAYVLPGGFIFAMTSQQISINLVAEIIPGYLLPGKPFSNMLFKTFSVQSLLVGLAFIQDLKLGHYMKIPPRVTFIVQIVAAILSAVVQIGVKKFLVATVPDMCDKHQANLLTCPNTSVFYSASVLWGLLGPQRQFGEGTTYRPIVYFTFVGAILPIPFYLMTKRWPNSWLKYVNLPVLLLGACWIPPATPINYSSYILVGFIFQYVLRRTKFRWWSKYNFVLSAGLDVGTVIGAIVIFFVLQLPRKGGSQGIDWWGNNVFMNTDDFDGTPLYDPPAEGFGPLEW